MNTNVESPRSAQKTARRVLIILATSLSTFAVLALFASVIPPGYISTDVNKETLREVGLALLAGAGACLLPLISMLGEVLRGVDETKVQLEKAIEAYKQGLATIDRAQERDERAIVEFRTQYITIKSEMERYASEVTKLSSDNLLRRFDEMLDIRNLLVKQLKSLRGTLSLDDQEKRLLLELELNCNRLLLVTRFPGSTSESYEGAVKASDIELSNIDRKLHPWMDIRLKAGHTATGA